MRHVRAAVGCWTLLTFASACSRMEAAPQERQIHVEWSMGPGGSGASKLSVFDGHVVEFFGQRLRVVDGSLRWGARSLGAVKPGDKVEFKEVGWAINGQPREMVGIEFSLTVGSVTINTELNEQSSFRDRRNRSGDVDWSFLDETLHVGDRAYGPIDPGDKVVVREDDVSINGKRTSALH